MKMLLCNFFFLMWINENKEIIIFLLFFFFYLNLELLLIDFEKKHSWVKIGMRFWTKNKKKKHFFFTFWWENDKNKCKMHQWIFNEFALNMNLMIYGFKILLLLMMWNKKIWLNVLRITISIKIDIAFDRFCLLFALEIKYCHFLKFLFFFLWC